NKNIVIDTTAPTVTGVTANVADGTYRTGQLVPIQVAFSEPVVVTGTPQLALNSAATASYASGSGTNTLTFNYTVGAGQTSPDLDYVGTGSLTLNSGTIRDAGLNNAVLTLPAPGGVGSISDDQAVVIDGVHP